MSYLTDENGKPLTRNGKMITAPPSGITDVTIDGESIVKDGIAKIQLAEDGVLGVSKARSLMYGIGINKNGELYINEANEINIKNRQQHRAITPYCIDYAVKSAMSAPIADTAGLVDGVYHYPAWTEEEQANARERMNCAPHAFIKLLDYTVQNGETVGNGVAFNDVFVLEDIQCSEIFVSIATPAITTPDADSSFIISISEDGVEYKDTGVKAPVQFDSSTQLYSITGLTFVPDGIMYCTATGKSYNGPTLSTNAWTLSGLKGTVSSGIIKGLKLREGYPKGQTLPTGTNIRIYGR